MAGMARFRILDGVILTLLVHMPLVVAFWRLQCFGVVAQGRIDPIVSPDKISEHVHTIKGSSGISANATVDQLLASNCTSCEVKQDRSAYWAPQLYFFAANGTVSAVPEIAGHITYYKYTPCYTSSGELKNPEPMPNNLRMVSGDTFRRNFSLPVPDPPMPWTGTDATQDALAQKAIGFNCLNYNKPPEPSLYRHSMPDKDWLTTNCVDGLRCEVLFPYCWSGALDSPDHKSHLAFPTANLNGGTCPPGYDRVINQLFFETIYPVANYANDDGFFAFSQGDPTGNGYHGDAMIAWEDDILAKATELCGPLSGPDASGVITDCPLFDVQDQTTQAQCKMPSSLKLMDDDVTTDLHSLPGNNPLQYGPEPATLVSSAVKSVSPASRTPSPSETPQSSISVLVSTGAAKSSRIKSSAAPTTSSSCKTSGSIQSATGTGTGAGEKQTTSSLTTLNMPDEITITTIYSTKGAKVYEIVEVEVFVTETVAVSSAGM